MFEPTYFTGKMKIGGKNLLWESVFTDDTTYSCHRCGLCCNLVSLTPKDAESLRKEGLGDSVVSPDKQHPLRMATFKTQRNGNCVHLRNDNLCSIYPLRPMMCKGYPYIISPGTDGKMYVDLSYRCPYTDLNGMPKVKRGDVESALKLNIEHVPGMLLRSMEYRKSLAEHLMTAYGPAMIPRERRIEFINTAFKQVTGLKDPCDLPAIMRNWSDDIGAVSHGIVVDEWNSLIGDAKQDKEIITNIKKPANQKEYVTSAERWRFMLEDIGNAVFWLDDALKVKWAPVRIGKDLRIDNKKVEWNKLTSLCYSHEALLSLGRYINALIRRPAFDITLAKVAGYIVEYRNVPVVDYEISSIILSNALIIHLDPISRIIAYSNGHSRIEAEDMRLAICNTDSEILSAMTDATLAKSILSRIDLPEID